MHMGKTDQPHLIDAAIRKHPHARGEDLVPKVVEGKLEETPPAHAGKT